MISKIDNVLLKTRAPQQLSKLTIVSVFKKSHVICPLPSPSFACCHNKRWQVPKPLSLPPHDSLLRVGWSTLQSMIDATADDVPLG